MKNCLAAVVIALLSSSIVQAEVADDEFYGIIESRPDGTVGTWNIGGRSIEATEDTDLDEDNGPLEIGACAEVDMDEGKVDEIETKPAEKCDQ